MNSLALILESALNQVVTHHESNTPEERQMKSNKLMLASILLFGVASIAVPSMAGGKGKGCDDMHHAAGWSGQSGLDGRHLRGIGKALDLTDSQKETLKTQREANKAAHQALQTKLFDAREALATAASAGASDSELNALADTLGKLQAEQALAGAKTQQAFLAVLTEEQKQTLAQLKAKRLERRENRKETLESTKS